MDDDKGVKVVSFVFEMFYRKSNKSGSLLLHKKEDKFWLRSGPDV